MKHAAFFVLCFGASLIAWLPDAQAQTRTWVSGVGDDLNPCSRTAPCKTFAGAISKTAAGGEIIEDSGVARLRCHGRQNVDRIEGITGEKKSDGIPNGQ